MNPNFETPRPEIKVYYKKNSVPKDVIRQVTLGIEEEGVPFVLLEKDYEDATKLAYKAAEASNLGVGIGIGPKNISLHFIKLREDEPLFTIPVGSDEEFVRSIGANAARLIMRKPFKPVE